MNPEMIGLAAGVLTTASFVPQVWKIWCSKSGRDISYGMFTIFSLGVLFWLIYGIQIGSLPIILANIVTLALSVSVIVLKFYYERGCKE